MPSDENRKCQKCKCQRVPAAMRGMGSASRCRRFRGCFRSPRPVCFAPVQSPAVLLANNVVRMLCLPCFAPPEPATSSTTSGSFTYMRVSCFPFQAGAPGAGLLRAALWRRGRRGAGGGGAARQPQIPHPGWRLPPDRRRARVRAVRDFLPYPLEVLGWFTLGCASRLTDGALGCGVFQGLSA